MNFNYADYFGRTPSTGYETLIYDCMIGDSTLFQRADMVEAGWSVVDPLLESVGSSGRPRIFRTTPPEAGDRRKPKNCCAATAATGAPPRLDSQAKDVAEKVAFGPKMASQVIDSAFANFEKSTFSATTKPVPPMLSRHQVAQAFSL